MTEQKRAPAETLLSTGPPARRGPETLPPGTLSRRRRRRQRARRLVRFLGGGALLALVVVALAVPWAIGWVKDRARAELAILFREPPRIGGLRVSYSPLGLHLRDFEVFLEGRRVLRARHVYLDFELRGWELGITRLGIHDADMVFLRDEEGAHSVPRVLRGEAFREGGGDPVVVPSFEIFNSTVTYEDTRLARPVRLVKVSAVVRPRRLGSTYFARMSGGLPGGGRLAVDGDFRLEPEITGELDWRLDRVSSREIVSLFGPMAPRFEGMVRGRGRLHGLLRRPGLEGHLRADDLSFRIQLEEGKRKLFLRGLDLGLRTREGELVLQPAVQRVGYRGPLISSRGVTVEDASGTFFVSGDGIRWTGVVGRPVGGGAWRCRQGYWKPDGVFLHMEVDEWPTAEALQIFQVDEFAATGEVAGSLILKGSRDQPFWQIRLKSGRGTLGLEGSESYHYQDLAAELSGQGEHLRAVDRLQVGLVQAELEASGRVDLQGDRSALVFRIENLALAPLGPLVRGRIEGLASFAGDLSGAVREPRLRGRLHVRSMEYQPPGGQTLDLEHFQVEVDAARRDGQVTGELSRLRGRFMGGGLIEGGGDLSPEGGGLTLRITDLDVKKLLLALGVPGVSVAGTASAVARVEVARDAPPSASLQVRAERCRFHLAETGTTLELTEVAGGLDLAPKGDRYLLYFRDLKARTLGGEATVDGYVKVHPELYYDLAVELRGGSAEALSRQVLEREDFLLEGPAAGRVTVEGDAGRSTVQGTVELGDSDIALRLGDAWYRLYPQRLKGELRLTPEELVLGPLSGQLAEGQLRVEYRMQLDQEELPWRLSTRLVGVDARRFWGRYLTQEHDLAGIMDGHLLLNGRGKDRDYLAGAGELRVQGEIQQLDALDQAEGEYDLRNLRGIRIEEGRVNLVALAGRLHGNEVVLKTSHGSARGDIFLGLRSGELDGGFDVALDRKVLSSSHRLVTALEGGRYFNFDLDVGGTVSEPRYSFRSDRLMSGALMTGALMFTPAAVPLAVIQGLRNLFRRRR